MKTKRILCFALVLSGVLFGCSTTNKQVSGLPIRYHNAQYDFTFYLPESWKGYSVLTEQWDDSHYSQTADGFVTTERGPFVILRHPQWTSSEPYQDIPILVFTSEQWNKQLKGDLWPSRFAGGVMDELWHNHKYVFAISSRYNAADDVKGWREAADIIATNCAAYPEPHLRDE